MELNEFIQPMDGPHRRSAILRISDVCNVTKQTVIRWIESGGPRKAIYKEAINEEFSKKIFEL